MRETYILVDPNDDSGNDDGILDKLEMTEEEAKGRNNERRRMNSDLRWIKLGRASDGFDSGWQDGPYGFPLGYFD